MLGGPVSKEYLGGPKCLGDLISIEGLQTSVRTQVTMHFTDIILF